MPLAYLVPLEAQSRLLQRGLYTMETVPSEAALETVLTDIEAVIDDWVGYRAAPTEYTKVTKSDYDGILQLPPDLLSITRITASGLVYFNSAQLEMPVPDPLATWDRQNFLNVGYPQTAITLEYRAGLDPLPHTFKVAATELLANSAANGRFPGDLSHLNERVQNVSSLSLKGISQSFSDPNATSKSTGVKAERTELDRLLINLGLAKYRRQVAVVV